MPVDRRGASRCFFFEKKKEKEDSLFDSVFIELIIRVGLLLASGDTSVAPAGSSARVALLLARTAALQNLIKQLMCAFVGEGLFSQKKKVEGLLGKRWYTLI